MIYKNTDSNFKPGRICAATAAGLLAKVYATIGSASMQKGESITVKTGVPFVLQNVNGTMTKVYTEPVPTIFAKDQVAGYEKFSSNEYYSFAYQIAGDIIRGCMAIINWNLMI